MKILNVNFSIDPVNGGGTAERTNQMSRYLSQKNHDCTILTFFSNPNNEHIDEFKNIKLIILPYFLKRFFIPKGGFKQIKKAVHEADIIHIMNHWTILNAIVYCYARYFRKPYIVCPAGALPIFGRSKIFKKVYNLIIGKRIINNADGYIAIAENEIEHYKSYGVDKEKITLIPNGVFVEDFQEIKTVKPRINLPEKYILFMGRLNFIKGPDLILHAFANLPKEYDIYHLVFAGPDGGMLSSLQDSTKKLNLSSRIHFLGGVSGIDKNYAYQNCLFLVVPSRQEAMSIVVVEAGIFSKPALITNQCGFDLEDIEAGYVVPPSIEGIEQGLIKMFASTRKIEMGNSLHKLVLKNYTWYSVGEKLSVLYKSILEK
ncbi:glycosyltransferase [Legionella gratiana]|uniref:Glycosyltransferase n=1 Tax=Legionella gratiana TaxID=45066 RepID=A0A378J2L7_9GAMM|nr:glycosyltransferase [Legionella gratiana]KTD11586.1 glycosyltransferase [Legionella gratiana]STX41211.1 glycosyltransferase [Legionella gratiana]